MSSIDISHYKPPEPDIDGRTIPILDSNSYLRHLSRQHTAGNRLLARNAANTSGGPSLPPITDTGRVTLPVDDPASARQRTLRRDPVALIEVTHDFADGFAEDGDDGGGTGGYAAKRSRQFGNWYPCTLQMEKDRIQYFYREVELLENRKRADQHVFQEAINHSCRQDEDDKVASACPRCGGGGVPQCAPIAAQIITLHFAHDVLIPVFTCPRCAARSELEKDAHIFHPKPAEFGVWPASPVLGLSVWKAKEGQIPVFFDLLLMHVLLGHKDRNGQVAIDSFLSTVLDNIKRTGCTLRFAPDTLRKNLNDAYTWFSRAETKAMDLGSHGVEGCDHISDVCGACRGAKSYYAKIAGEISPHAHTIADKSIVVEEGLLADIGDEDGAAERPQSTIGCGNSFQFEIDNTALISGYNAQMDGPNSGGNANGQAFGANRELAGLENLVKAVQHNRSTFMRFRGPPQVTHSLGCDACFGLRHHASAGSATPFERSQQINTYMVPDEIVEAACKSKPFAAKGSNVKDCVDMAASNAASRCSPEYDKTGVMAVTCRHHFVLAMCNLFTGERWAYATIMLFMLLSAGMLPLFWWYDINCRYASHVMAWAAACSGTLLTPTQAEWVQRLMKFPLPPWHHYMHNLACQRLNSFKRMFWAGLGHGEPYEILWSKLRGMGSLLQSSTLAGRQLAIERAVALWNRNKRLGLPDLLGRMFYRAKLKKEEASARVTAISNEMRKIWEAATPEAKATLLAQINDVQNNPPSMDMEDINANLEPEAEYVYLLMVLDVIASSDQAADGRIDLLLEGATVAKLKPDSPFATKSMKRIDELKQNLGITDDWLRDSSEFKSGWASYLVHRLRLNETALAQSHINIGLLRYLYTKFQGRRKDVKRLDKTRERENKRCETALVTLVQVARELKVAVATVNEPSPFLMRGKKEADAILVLAKDGRKPHELKDLHAAVLKAEFPWFNLGRGGEEQDLNDAHATSQVERYRAPLHMAFLEVDRSTEELQLIRAEMEGLVGQFQEESETIQAAMNRHQVVVNIHNINIHEQTVLMEVEESHRMDLNTVNVPDAEFASFESNQATSLLNVDIEDPWEAGCRLQRVEREAEAAKSSITFLAIELEETKSLKKATELWLQRVISHGEQEIQLREVEQVVDAALEEFVESVEVEDNSTEGIQQDEEDEEEEFMIDE